MSTQISTGNIVRFFTGCPCGRGWETMSPLEVVPDHVHHHRLISDTTLQHNTATHTCTGCSWHVETHTGPHNPATGEALRKAFAQHLLTTALEATA